MSKSQAVQTEAVRSPVPPEAAPTPPPPISMHHLSELKQHHVTQLVEMAVASGIEGANRMRKQDLIFAMLKNTAKKGESIFGDGTLEVLPDGFGFLRSPETSYLASTDDIYVSPSQIRRFNLHTGDSIEGEIRTPKDGERGMRRWVRAEVVAPPCEGPARRQVQVAEMVTEKAKRLVEHKKAVVILLASITRLARAYNPVVPASGKVLTGGVDANALQK